MKNIQYIKCMTSVSFCISMLQECDPKKTLRSYHFMSDLPSSPHLHSQLSTSLPFKWCRIYNSQVTKLTLAKQLIRSTGSEANRILNSEHEATLIPSSS